MTDSIIIYGRNSLNQISPIEVQGTGQNATISYGFLFPSQVTQTQSTGHTAIPSGTTAIHIMFCGGGGGGGNYGASGDHGGGGAGSETCYVWLKSSDISTNTHIYSSIGLAGAGGPFSGSDGGSGNTTTVRFSNGSSTSGTIIGTALGGGGGINGNNYAQGGTGGNGGTITTGLGYHIAGDSGEMGWDSGTPNQNPVGGSGGSSKIGRGGLGATDIAGGNATAGIKGGGGGGGCLGSDASTPRDPASGGTGLVIMMFYQ